MAIDRFMEKNSFLISQVLSSYKTLQRRKMQQQTEENFEKQASTAREQ
ncbi:MAG: hypothetical protein IKS29_02405 [Oscillospiraceae bacterium]|nr:hypothetical protein [Oscillospiraceae bacterium]